MLAADGIQPEKSNETFLLLRNLLSGRVLVARDLLSSSCEDLAPQLAEVKEFGVLALGVISDKQSSICLAVEKEAQSHCCRVYRASRCGSRRTSRGRS